MKLSDLHRRLKVYNFRGEKSKASDVASPGLLSYAQNDIVEPKITTIDQRIDPTMKSSDLGKEDHYETSEDDSDKFLTTQRDNIKDERESTEPQSMDQFANETFGTPKKSELVYRSGNQSTPPSNPRHRRFMGFPPKSYN